MFAVLGDFNLADVWWSSYYASSEYSMNILRAFGDLNLFQRVSFPTILSGNTRMTGRDLLSIVQRKPTQTIIQFSLMCMSLVMIVLQLMSQGNCVQRRFSTRNELVVC